MTDVSTALYRKYRPQSFGEVKNQEHIIQVLEGAIKKRVIPHALLFVGPRGTGKTTVARVFAKALGVSEIDTYEIDAASNRRVEDVRDLKEAVHTLPYESPYKVYIVDEVHMLTPEAFNALLKTLEEPPHHVVFILATTERDKLPLTIVSRCQVFDFHTPTRAELREVIHTVAQKEHMQLTVPSADIIAVAADGSYRDALGITQKVMLASADTVLTTDEVASIVGAPKNVLLAGLLKALQERDTEAGLSYIHEAREAHVDMKLLGRMLLDRIRSVVMVRHNKQRITSYLQQYNTEDQEAICAYAADTQSPINSHLLLRAIDRVDSIGKTLIPELSLELLFVELS